MCGGELVERYGGLWCFKCGWEVSPRGLEPIRRTYDADELGIDQEDDD